MTFLLILLALLFLPWQIGLAILIGMVVGPVIGVISLVVFAALSYEGE